MWILFSLFILFAIFLGFLLRWHDQYIDFSQEDAPRYGKNYAADVTHAHDSKTFKIVSYNIRHSIKVTEAINVLCTHQDLINADVICLQEMDMPDVDEIAQRLKYNYVYYPAAMHKKTSRHFGNAILSPHPFIFDKKHMIVGDVKHDIERIAVEAHITIGTQVIGVVNVHMGIFLAAQKRNTQLKHLLDHISRDPDHFLIAGDFNTFTAGNIQSINRAAADFQFYPATQQIGWSHRNGYFFGKKTLLDHIFVKGFPIIKAGKIVDLSASDHLPIWTTCTLTNT